MKQPLLGVGCLSRLYVVVGKRQPIGLSIGRFAASVGRHFGQSADGTVWSADRHDQTADCPSRIRTVVVAMNQPPLVSGAVALVSTGKPWG